MQRLLVFILFVSIWGCSTSENQISAEQKLGSVYISSGVEAYFLGDLPHWANFSSWAECQRKEPIRYMNFDSIKKSFDLKYVQMVHLQHMWNRKISAFRTSTGQGEVPLKEEAFIFNNVYAQVLGGSYDFMPPNFQNISLIWIDPYFANAKELKSILDSENVQAGYPILLSHCKTSIELEEWVQKHKLEEYGAKLVTADMFSIYDKEIKHNFNFVLDISALLPNKNIVFYAKSFPPYVLGEFKKVELK